MNLLSLLEEDYEKLRALISYYKNKINNLLVRDINKKESMVFMYRLRREFIKVRYSNKITDIIIAINEDIEVITEIMLELIMLALIDTIVNLGVDAQDNIRDNIKFINTVYNKIMKFLSNVDVVVDKLKLLTLVEKIISEELNHLLDALKSAFGISEPYIADIHSIEKLQVIIDGWVYPYDAIETEFIAFIKV